MVIINTTVLFPCLKADPKIFEPNYKTQKKTIKKVKFFCYWFNAVTSVLLSRKKKILSENYDLKIRNTVN